LRFNRALMIRPNALPHKIRPDNEHFGYGAALIHICCHGRKVALGMETLHEGQINGH